MSRVGEFVRGMLGTSRPAPPASTPPKVVLYRYHPLTGDDAEELPIVSDEHRIELADMRRHGARFYWEKIGAMFSDDPRTHQPDSVSDGHIQGYARCELTNISFVLNAMGISFEINEQRP